MATPPLRSRRWKLPSFHHRSTAPPSPLSAAAAVPAEFLCPISGVLMADPVIVPSGQTFERACIEACADLAACGGKPAPLLIPNVALKAAIHGWCDRAGVPRPAPPDAAVAHASALRFPPSGRKQLASFPQPPAATFLEKEEAGEVVPASPRRPATAVTLAVTPSSLSSASCSSLPSSSSSYPSSEIHQEGVKQETPNPVNGPADATLPATASDDLEEQIVATLADSDADPSDIESAAAALRRATRESAERRLELCTPRLLDALRRLVLSRLRSAQADAAAAVVNLSLEPANKVPLVRAGVVVGLVAVLKGGSFEAREHAAAAVLSLALEEENRAAIGVLGAVPPLLGMFAASSGASCRARRDAGMALYHLSLAAANRSKIVRAAGAACTLLAVATESTDEEEPALGRVAMMLVRVLAGCADGRSALMDSGAVAAVVGLMRRGSPATSEWCVEALFLLSHSGLRFRGLALAAGADEVLAPLARGAVDLTVKEMAKKTLRAMKGGNGSCEAFLMVMSDGDWGVLEDGTFCAGGASSEWWPASTSGQR